MKKIISLLCLVAVIPAFAFAEAFPAATCNESHFKPCICASKAPKDLQYRPRLSQCGGRAGVILKGRLAGSFSVVLRDRENRDRFPATGFNGCTASQAALGPNRCSAYKVQKTIKIPGGKIQCFGAAGSSRILSKTTRLTIKLKDSPTSTNDPLLRICLPLFSARYPIN